MTVHSPGRPTDLPRAEELWADAAVLAVLSAGLRPGYLEQAELDEHGLRSLDSQNGWWTLSRWPHGRMVLCGIDDDYGETLLEPPVDLLAGGPDWLPADYLADPLGGGETVGLVYWWDGSWGRAPYPDGLRDDGLAGLAPVSREEWPWRHDILDCASDADEAGAAYDALLSAARSYTVDEAALGRLFGALDVGRLTTEMHASIDLTAALDVARRAGLTQG
ncbi:hypothetical protein [Actinomadura sp. DC4]|uniref:hypothetical protein n=1 Tax=Actinomadura sp. DC4 TaxID=3055069 RepID=UPI0025B0B42D|nr:hypothetical protein [Actinomadura sp. DC4]MDN3353747.1 hypothetical protein [Actinomadura sp. DC4]